MDNYKFSVAMCVYGGDDPKYFSEAVDSMRNQTQKPNEIVIVRDGPVPEAIEDILTEYEKDDIFKIVRLEKNCGHGIARRTSLENATYDIVALMDADDISVPERFEKQIEVFKNNNDISICGGNIAEFIDDIQNVVGIREVPAEDKDIKEYMKKRCPMNQVTVMFKKEHIQKVGGYIDWYCEEDYYLWIRMALAGMVFYNIQDILVNVRVGKEMYQRRGSVKYFKSEAGIQLLMLKNKLISFPQFFINMTLRLILQVLMPNKLRGFIFRRFARK